MREMILKRIEVNNARIKENDLHMANNAHGLSSDSVNELNLENELIEAETRFLEDLLKLGEI